MLRIGATLLAGLAIFFLVVLTMIMVALIFFIIAAVLLVVYLLIVKKPEVEHQGDWRLDKVRENKD